MNKWFLRDYRTMCFRISGAQCGPPESVRLTVELQQLGNSHWEHHWLGSDRQQIQSSDWWLEWDKPDSRGEWGPSQRLVRLVDVPAGQSLDDWWRLWPQWPLNQWSLSKRTIVYTVQWSMVSATFWRGL